MVVLFSLIASLAVLIGCSVAAGCLAYSKNRGEVAWGVFTFLFLPAFLILACLPKLPPYDRRRFPGLDQ